MKITAAILKGILKFVIKPGAKLTSKIVRIILVAFLKMSLTTLQEKGVGSESRLNLTKIFTYD
jgi:hypothetical protein